jgi:hypothetical protein
VTLAAGDTFLITDPDFGKQHLRIVLTGPTGTPPSVLTVQLNTATALADRTTVLCIGDHPFCRRETVVSYDTIQVMEVALLAELERRESLVRDPMFRRMEPFRHDLLDRVQSDALRSPMTTPRMVRELQNRLERT